MRKLPRPAPNPGYQPPRAYMAGGFFAADGTTIRPALLAEAAAAMGRELLIRAVPLPLVQEVHGALVAIARLPLPQLAPRLQALAARPDVRRHPLLAELLAEGARHVRRPADLAALATHMRRVLVLASFNRALAGANAAELARSERAERVRRARKQRTGR